MSNATAETYLYDIKGSSYPNPSIDGGSVTYTFNEILLSDYYPSESPFDLDSIYPAQDGTIYVYAVGSAPLYMELPIGTAQVHDGKATLTVPTNFANLFYTDVSQCPTNCKYIIGCQYRNDKGEVIRHFMSIDPYIVLTQSVTRKSVNVPEFPSIILPIAAIIGLLIIVGKK